LQRDVENLVNALESTSLAVQVLMVARTIINVLPGTVVEHLGPLSESDAVQLLRWSCPNTSLSDNEALTLARRCECNATLLLFMAGIFNRRGRSILTVCSSLHLQPSILHVCISPHNSCVGISLPL
jgi:hypothetical protein